MAHIILIRPGVTPFDEQGRLLGSLDVPLSETGRRQAEQMALQLADCNLHRIHTAPCRRSIETAEVIARSLGIRCIQLSKLRNLNHGLWEGKKLDEIRKSQPRVFRIWQEQPEAIRPPEGETIEEARERIRKCLEKLRADRASTVALVVPEPLASIAAEILYGKPLKNLWKSISGEWGIWEEEETSSTSLAAIS